MICRYFIIAELAEDRKDSKYKHLGPAYIFTRIAIETSGAIGPRARAFLKQLGRRLRRETGEANSTSHLMQRLSVAVQCGNAAVILACILPN